MIVSIRPFVYPLFNTTVNDEVGLLSRTYPAIDVAEYPGETVLVAELPGMKKEDVSISVENGVLSISGERRVMAVPENASWIRNEIGRGRFHRTLALPHEVDLERIAAELSNGVLRITLPKAEAARPREIRIN